MSETDRHLHEAIGALRAAVWAEEAAARAGLDQGDYDASRAAIARAEAIQALAAAVSELVGPPPEESQDQQADRADRRNLGRLARGVKTSDRAFRVPILQALADLGGSARVGDVLDRVGRIMEDQLRPIDREGLPSDPRLLRWRNTAQWERLAMVEAGLLRGDSPRGTWEISDAGRRYLAEESGRRD